MCSIVITNKTFDNLDHINYYTRFRGPDSTNVFERDGVTFIHNLLSMTGDFTTQPFIEDDIVCLHNGEIYNYKTFGDYESDGQCLIPLYKEHGIDFIKKLDGEFAIFLIDFSKKISIISTDVFGTKPLWHSKEGEEFGVASYKSALDRIGFKNIERVPANHYIINHDQNHRIFDFDLKQHKSSFDDWTTAYKESIRKRYEDSSQKVFIGLSSGYDSGAIACELNEQNVDHYAYTSIGNENTDILKARHKLIPKNSKGFFIKGSSKDYNKAHSFIEDCVEEFTYEIYSDSSDYNEFGMSLKDDNGSNGLSYICSRAKSDDRKIYISGQGSDEIFADYGFKGIKKFKHSNFGGLYPDDLSTIFPWASFYDSTQRSYLMKEEYISGAYGLEGRYPFLDKYVVQEFLWLLPELKNGNYKSVLFNYLTEHNYPFEPDVKTGFSLLPNTKNPMGNKVSIGSIMSKVKNIFS